MTEFLKLLCALKESEDSSKRLNILLGIRKEVDWPRCKENINILREKHCLQPIIKCLQSSQRSIVDVVLSILGNCCMDVKCVRELKEHNILAVLHQLLKRHGPKEDSINGRIFRILGNMCQHRENWSVIIIDRKPKIITYVVDFLKLVAADDVTTISEATVIMAVRLIRELLSSQLLLKLVKTFGVLKSLGLVLIKYSQLWKEDKQHENVLHNIIKTLYEYSKYKSHFSILEMKNTEKGNSLLCLSDVLLLAPKRIVKIVMNLLHMSHLQSDLPVPEIFNGFIKILEDKTFMEELHGECVDYIQCLCYLYDHPANRNSNSCEKSIAVLINALKDFDTASSTSLTCCILMISTLNKCKYNDALIVEQLNCDIIKVLTDKLEWIVGSSKTINLTHNHEKKRKYSFKHGFTGCKRILLPTDDARYPALPSSSDEEEVSPLSGYRSPSPCSSSDSDMTCRSWSTTPLNICAASGSDSEDYSPVCSEADHQEYLDESVMERCESAERELPNDFEDNFETEDRPVNSDMNLGTLRSRFTLEIMKLLKTYTRVEPPHPQLASYDLLLALIKSSTFVTFKLAAFEVVCRILQYHDFLIPLMQTDLIATAHTLTKVEHGSNCIKCVHFNYMGSMILKRFSNLAESEVGKGDVAYKMLRGNKDIKQQLTLVIPYIIRNKSILSKLMINCGGLEILMKLLRTNSELREKCIKVTCVLASKRLAICNPTRLVGDGKLVIIVDHYRPSQDCSNFVTFILDDGKSIKADKEFLSSKSDYFDALLNGNFKESTEQEVRLHGVKARSFQYFLNLLQQFDVKNRKTLDIDVDLPTLLDVIILSDKYLLTDLCLGLTGSVEKFRISADTVPMIYKWSIETKTNFLRVESVAFALVADILDVQRVDMFNKLFDLGYSEELVNDIQVLLVRYMNRTSV